MSRKIIAAVLGLSLLSLSIGIGLLGSDYGMAAAVCTVLGALVFIPTLVVTVILNSIRKHREPKVKYGRYNNSIK